MKMFLGCLMIGNAALFFFGALQHAGVRIGNFHEPDIIPAAIVESICGLSLLWGVTAVFGHSPVAWRTALIANLVPLGGVLLGMAALAAGRGPRTASNDLYHHIMLALIGASLLILFFARSALVDSETLRHRTKTYCFLLSLPVSVQSAMRIRSRNRWPGLVPRSRLLDPN